MNIAFLPGEQDIELEASRLSEIYSPIAEKIVALVPELKEVDDKEVLAYMKHSYALQNLD